MTKKVLRKQQQPKSTIHFTWLWTVAVALLFVVIGLFVWYRVDRQPTPKPQVTGAPRLAVAQTTIDEGDVKLGKTIQSTFRLQNVGDQALQIEDAPQVEVVEGC